MPLIEGNSLGIRLNANLIAILSQLHNHQNKSIKKKRYFFCDVFNPWNLKPDVQSLQSDSPSAAAVERRSSRV
jgi:hypothetical protein